ncbi:MAG TPA: metallophosphoesterase [Gemmatimonadales bacterium]|nr:metallophosphoesterase [Gemmatimonadales bacterium]
MPNPPTRLFAEAHPGADPTSFQVKTDDETYYDSPYYLAHKNEVQPIPKPRAAPQRMDLADVVGPDEIRRITGAGAITFHAVGDTGASKESHLPNELAVADLMAADVQKGGKAAPAFFFHLGDVVYSFGEGRYYFDQFYDPFRGYDRPIFAIPGNHDGMVFGVPPAAPATLEAFLRNFCAAQVAPSPDGAGLVRSVMTQPSVYFTLDAPFVSIVGLYSNVLDGGPGIISSQGGHFPIGDEQLAFLTAELARLKPLREQGRRAVIVAVHHPPLSVDAKHGGATGLSTDLDACFTRAGLWPDAVFSGHAHLYQRFTRTVQGRQIPYVVAGSGGYNVKASGVTMTRKTTVGDVTLEKPPILAYGYLLVTVSATQLTVAFRSPSRGPKYTDQVTVNLKTHRLV